MIGWAPGCCRLYAGKAEVAEIQFLDRGIDDTHRIKFGNIVIE